MEMLYSLSLPTSPYIALKILRLPLFQEWHLLLNCKFKSTEIILQIVDYFILEKHSSKFEDLFTTMFTLVDVLIIKKLENMQSLFKNANKLGYLSMFEYQNIFDHWDRNYENY